MDLNILVGDLAGSLGVSGFGTDDPAGSLRQSMLDLGSKVVDRV